MSTCELFMGMDTFFFSFLSEAVVPLCVCVLGGADEEGESWVIVSDPRRITATLLQFAGHKCLKSL